MAWKPSFSDLVLIKRPYNWLENRFVKDPATFYKPERYKAGMLTGLFLYVGFTVSCCKIYQNLDDDWQYTDLSPTLSIARYSMAAREEEDDSRSRAKILWTLSAGFTFWAGDFAFMYAARNRRFNKERGENREKLSEIAPPTR